MENLYACVVCVTYKTRWNFIRTTMRNDCDNCVVQFETNLKCYRSDDISEILHRYTTSTWKLHTNKFYCIFSIYLYMENYVGKICNQSKNVHVCGDLHHTPSNPVSYSVFYILYPTSIRTNRILYFQFTFTQLPASRLYSDFENILWLYEKL